MAINRTYGLKRNLGDIIYNPISGVVTCTYSQFFFKTIKIGQTFPVFDADKTEIKGITKATLRLLTSFNSLKNKKITNSEYGLFITTHKLKEIKAIGDKGLVKVGYLTGEIGIENKNANSYKSQIQEEPDSVSTLDDNKEILF